MAILTGDWLWLIMAAAITDNVVLSSMLGLCPVVNLSKRLDTAVGVGLATTAILTLAGILAWPINQLLPTSLERLQPLLLIALVACLVQAVTILMRLYTPLIHRTLGLFLPLIATNCAVLGIILLAFRTPHTLSFINTVNLAFGGGLGFLFALVIMAAIRERIVESTIPTFLRGMPLAMITIGIMTLAVAGLTGIIQP